MKKISKPRSGASAASKPVPLIVGPLPAFLFGTDRWMLWLCKDKKSAEAMKKEARSEKGNMPLFLDRKPIGGRGTLDMFLQHKMTKKHLLGGLMFRVPTELDDEYATVKDRIIVSHMAVVPKARRKGLNTLMLDEVKQAFPGREIYYYDLTENGEAFRQKYGGGISKRNPITRRNSDDSIRAALRAYKAEPEENTARYWRACLRAGELPEPTRSFDNFGKGKGWLLLDNGNEVWYSTNVRDWYNRRTYLETLGNKAAGDIGWSEITYYVSPPGQNYVPPARFASLEAAEERVKHHLREILDRYGY